MQVCTDEPTSIVLIWKLGRKLNKRGPIFSRDVKIPRERERQVDTSAAYQNGPVGPTWPRKSLSLKFFPLVRKSNICGTTHVSLLRRGLWLYHMGVHIFVFLRTYIIQSTPRAAITTYSGLVVNFLSLKNRI